MQLTHGRQAETWHRLVPGPLAELHQVAPILGLDLVRQAMLHDLELSIAFQHHHRATGHHLAQQGGRDRGGHGGRSAEEGRQPTGTACGLDPELRYRLADGPLHQGHNVRAIREGNFQVCRPPTGRRLRVEHPGMELPAVLARDATEDPVALEGLDEETGVDDDQLARVRCARAADVDPIHPKGALTQPRILADSHLRDLFNRRGCRLLHIGHETLHHIIHIFGRPTGEEDVVVQPGNLNVHSSAQKVFKPRFFNVPYHAKEGMAHELGFADLPVQPFLQRLAQNVESDDISSHDALLFAQPPLRLPLRAEGQFPGNGVFPQEPAQQPKMPNALVVGHLQVHHGRGEGRDKGAAAEQGEDHAQDVEDPLY
mmetsp:Transcript_41422/g.119250  ORF Transcript_41422/g.119250 Transcript_41422/m.119250 type:complete len:370 (-) Transcript_41422:1564-2673(-)